ncbi:MAG: vWA domain-containing protein [bacterium]
MLLLQILTVIFISLGLAQPTLFIYRNTRYIAFIIDTSASMECSDLKPSRLVYAKEKALRVLEGLKKGDKVAVFQSDSTVRLVLDYTEDRSLIKSAIKGITPNEVAGDIQSALLYIEHLNRKPDIIFIFSDGAFSSDLPNDLPINLYCFNKGDNNVGITNINARDVGVGTEKEILVMVQNFSSSNKSVPFQLWDGDKIVDSRVLDIKRKETYRVVIGPRIWRGPVRVNIYPNDVFPVDDHAYITFPKLKPSVLIVTPGNPYLETSIALSDIGMVDKVERFDPSAASRYDIIIFDGTSPDQVPPGNYLFIGKVPENLPLRIVETKEDLTVLNVNTLHPVMRFVDLEGIQIRRGVIFDASEGEDLISTPDGALAWSDDGFLGRIIALGFYPEESSFVERSSFPVFIKNAITWLGENPSPTLLKTGEPFKLRTSEVNELVSIVTPSDILKRSSDDKRRLIFNETYRVGIYSIKSKIGSIDVSVNLCSSSESDISQKVSEREFKGEVIPEEGGKSQLNLWYIFGLGALMALFTEGYLFYGRR